jgi:hypothetical protein
MWQRRSRRAMQTKEKCHTEAQRHREFWTLKPIENRCAGIENFQPQRAQRTQRKERKFPAETQEAQRNFGQDSRKKEMVFP